MKRKGSDFLGFFPGVTGTQRVSTWEDGWLVDFQIGDTPQRLTQRVGGREVASLSPGHRWLYWVPRGGESTCLVFLDDRDRPVWCYADVIAGSGMDERGFPWTDDVYLDVVALCEVRDGRWVSHSAEIIDRHDLAQALALSAISRERANWAEAVAESVRAALTSSTYAPLERIEALQRQPG